MPDPFDTTGSDMPPQPSGMQGGMLNSPSFWNNLAAFGANMSVGANARTPEGFLAYGNGFAGPLGAGVLGAQQASQQSAQLRSELAARGAATQSQQIQNIMAGMQLPVAAAQAQGMLNYYQHNPFGVVPTPDQSSASPASPSYSLSSQPFVIPPEKRQKLVQDAVSGTPISPDTLDGLVSYESKWDANNTNAKSGAFGLGQILPSTAAQPGYGMAPVSMDDLRNPSNNLKFVAQYLYARGKSLGMQDADWKDPGKVAGVLAAYHGPQTDADGVNGAQYATAVGGRIQGPRSWQVAQNGGTSAPDAPQIGQPPMLPQPGMNVTPQDAMRLADQNQSLAVMSRAYKMDGTPYEQAAQQWREYALAGPKAGAVANAEIPAKSYLQHTAPYDIRTGGMHVDPQTGVVTKNPERVEVQLPDGRKVYGSWSPSENGGPGSVTVTPGADGQPAVAQNSPMTQSLQNKRGDTIAEQREEIDKEATNAVEDNFRWDQMRQESQSWDMNKFAPTFQSANAYLQATADTLGIKTPGLDQKVGDYQTFNKNAGNLVREAVRETSARASQQEYKMISETLPTAATSRDAFGQIADQMQGLNDWDIARQKFATKYQGNPDGMSMALNSSLSPAVFMLHRMGMTPDGSNRLGALLSKMQETPFGRTMANEMMKKYAYAQSNGYFDAAPTQ